MAHVKKLLGGALSGLMISTLVHISLAGSLYYGLILREPPPIVAELDLSMTPLLPAIPNAGGGYGAKPSETWTLPKTKETMAPVPAPEPAAESKEEVVKEENAAPCPEPCNEAQMGNGSGWGGGTGEGEGQYIPVEQASRKPRWVRNFITSRDYPLIARQQGKDGRVVLSILIDTDGKVRDARLLEGSYEALNEVALRKVKDAVFTPAYDQENRAVSCKVTLPIRFELR